MDLGIRNKHALITGASRGIGAAVCESLAREGVFVTAVARSQQDLQKLESVIGSKNNLFGKLDSCLTGSFFLKKLLARQEGFLIKK